MGVPLGGKAPSPPDYTAAAQAQAQGSRENVIEQTFANRPNVYTPYGSVTWQTPNYPGVGYEQGGQSYQSQQTPQDGAGGMVGSALGGAPGGGGPGQGGGAPGGGYDPREWAMTLNLPPEMQAALESQQRIASGRSQMGEQLLGSAGADLARGFDWNALPGFANGPEARQRAEQAIYERTASRLDPMWQQRESSAETRLANQGLAPGTEAYQRSMENLGRERNDAYQNAMREAIMGGGSEASRQQALDLQARQQGISEGLQRQYGGMNALNAFLAGQQVQQPQMPGFNTAGQAQAPQYMQAANLGYQGALNQYGANQAQLQQLMGGMSGLVPFML